MELGQLFFGTNTLVLAPGDKHSMHSTKIDQAGGDQNHQRPPYPFPRGYRGMDYVC